MTGRQTGPAESAVLWSPEQGRQAALVCCTELGRLLRVRAQRVCRYTALGILIQLVFKSLLLNSLIETIILGTSSE